MRDAAFGTASYLIGLLGMAFFAGLVFSLGMDWGWPRLELPWPWAVNVSWLLLFGLQHSGMARVGFKDWLGKFFPPHLERSLYVALSGMMVMGMAFTWQSLPGPMLWEGPAWVAGIACLGAAGVVWCSRAFDHLEFLGMRQAWTGRAEEQGKLEVRGPYRFVRHPLMLAVLLFLWGHPTMPLTLAVLSGGLTIYILVALRWEERDLVRQFGGEYERFRQRVPMILPRLRPKRPLDRRG